MTTITSVPNKQGEAKFDWNNQNETLHDCIRKTLDNYFANLQDDSVTNVYDMVVAEVEVPLLQTIMAFTNHNQSKAYLEPS